MPRLKKLHPKFIRPFVLWTRCACLMIPDSKICRKTNEKPFIWRLEASHTCTHTRASSQTHTPTHTHTHAYLHLSMNTHQHSHTIHNTRTRVHPHEPTHSHHLTSTTHTHISANFRLQPSKPTSQPT